VTKGLCSSHCDMYLWTSDCVIELRTSHCDKLLCSTHYDVGKCFSHCDIRIWVAHCEMMICSWKCDDRAMSVTLWHLFMIITLQNLGSSMYITLSHGLCSISCDVWKVLSHYDIRICAIWWYFCKNEMTWMCSSKCDIYLSSTHCDIIMFFRLQRNYVCHIAMLQWRILHVALQCRVMNVALRWWVLYIRLRCWHMLVKLWHLEMFVSL
jgi:hypothetical protein